MTKQTSSAQPNVLSQQELDNTLMRAKGRLFFKKGAAFLGSLLCSHKVIWDDTEPTAWCDGSTIGLNRAFWSGLSNENRVTLLAHELWHTGYDHMGRLGNRCPDVWNYAADFVINNALDQQGYDFSGMDPLLDHQYDGMTTEQVYDELQKNPQQLPKNCPTPGNGQGQQGQGSQQGDSQPLPDLSGDVRRPAKPEEHKQEIIGKLVKARQQAQMAKEAGIIPGETQLMLENFLNPVLPWEIVLAQFFTELSQDDYSWKRPSRRHEEEYLPSLMGENGLEHLIYFLDISGSVSDEEIHVFNSEVHYIHTELRPVKLSLVTFDTKIQDVYEFEQDQPFEKIVVNGRGGTSFAPVLKYIEKHRPTAAVIFSDMYCKPMAKDPGIPIIWAALDRPGFETEFGRVIHITREMLDRE